MVSIRTISLPLLAVLVIAGCKSEQKHESRPEERDPSTWVIEYREVPPPTGVGEAFYEAIKSTPQPDIEFAKNLIPQSVQQWKAVQQERDSLGALNAFKLMEITGAKVEELEMNGVVVRKVTPSTIDKNFEKAKFVHLHGGAYTLNAGMAGATEAIVIAERVQIPVISVDYRMPPDHPFPAALDDAIAVYQKVLEDYPDHTVFLGGTSAGGGLVLATALKLKDDNKPLPAALFAGTPWTDLSKTGDSYFTNEGIDRLLVTYEGFLEESALLYAGGRDLKEPYLSPVYGDVVGFPPTIQFTGTRDLFLSNTARMDTKLRAAGVETQLIVLEGQSHADYMVALDAEESIGAFQNLKKFLLKYTK